MSGLRRAPGRGARKRYGAGEGGAGLQRSGRGRSCRIPRCPLSPLTCSRRLFTVYPSTKLYFTHLGGFPDEVQLLSHGRQMLEAVGVAAQHVDNLRAVLSPLADLHAHVLRVDPANFPVRQPGPQGGSREAEDWGVPDGTGGHPFTLPFSRSC